MLGFVFTFLSVDEATQIHDELIGTFEQRLAHFLPDFLSLGWMIPYFFSVLIIGIYCFKFIFTLPPKTRKLFILSGIIYVGAALGLEFFENHEYKLHGYSHLLFIYETLQEILEMMSINLFIYSLLAYIASSKQRVVFNQKQVRLIFLFVSLVSNGSSQNLCKIELN